MTRSSAQNNTLLPHIIDMRILVYIESRHTVVLSNQLRKVLAQTDKNRSFDIWRVRLRQEKALFFTEKEHFFLIIMRVNK